MSSTTDAFGRFGRKLSNQALLRTQGLIAGKWQAASDGATFPVYEPSSGTVVLDCPNFKREDIVAATLSAEEGQVQFWSSTTARERAALLRAWYELILQNSDDRKFLGSSPLNEVAARRQAFARLQFFLF